MMNLFRKDSPRLDGANYDSWKEKMKTHLLCMGSGYWLLTKSEKTIVKEQKIEECSKEERDLFMCDMRDREALLSTLPENEYSQVKSLETSHKIWKALESFFEGDTHTKRVRLQNWICAFQDANMMGDESVRSYIGRILEIIAGIKAYGGTKEEDEVVWKILKTLTPPFRQVAQMIQLLIVGYNYPIMCCP